MVIHGVGVNWRDIGVKKKSEDGISLSPKWARKIKKVTKKDLLTHGGKQVLSVAKNTI
jgi:hypothetical protein